MSGVTERVRDHGVPVRPGARELLAEVAAAGLPHALVTSSEREFMDAVLARTGLRFDALVCADDVSVTKPDPEPYLLAAKLLGADPARCVALEDSPNGVASAEAAGCRVIAVPSLVPIEPAPGRTVVRSLLDLRADASRHALARIRGVSPSACTLGYDLDSDIEPRGGARVSTYDKIAWLPLCGGTDRARPGAELLRLPAARPRFRPALGGLVAAADRRLPDRLDRDVLEDGRRDRGLRQGLRVLAAGVVGDRGGRPGRGAVRGVRPAAPARSRPRPGQAGRRVRGRRARTLARNRRPRRGQLATRPAGTRQPATVPAASPAKAPAKGRKARNADDDDDDLGDVADILRRHGIT